jgi:predicted peptidase
LVIYCHSREEAGTDIEKQYSTGLPKILQEGYTPSFDFIMIAPQHPSYSVDPKWLPAIVEDAERRWKIDESRVYLTGVSAGGWSAYGSQLNLDTLAGKLFAAIAVCSGATQDADKTNLDQWKATQTPLWAIVGEHDPAYITQNQYLVEEINKRVSGLATLTIRPNVGHGGWEDVYKGVVKNNSLDMWQWLYQFQRK